MENQESQTASGVPIHANKSLKTGLLRHFLKVARLSDDFQPISETDEDSEDN
jgi:hypothetical protein